MTRKAVTSGKKPTASDKTPAKVAQARKAPAAKAPPRKASAQPASAPVEAQVAAPVQVMDKRFSSEFFTALREEIGWSRVQLGKKVNRSEGWVRRIERGEIAPPVKLVDCLEAICAAIRANPLPDLDL